MAKARDPRHESPAPVADAAESSAGFRLLGEGGPDLDLSPEQFRHVSRLVYDYCGIHLQEGKQSLVAARIAKRVRARALRSIQEYLDVLSKDESGAEFECLIDAISTNLTSFFRENSHFEFLRKHLVERRAERPDARLRGWSAACSTGEEPYTLAMTIVDTLGPAATSGTRILATDISHTVLRKARAGHYPSDRVNAVPPALRQRFLVPVEGRDGGYRVVPDIAAMIKFNHLNLMEEWPFRGPFDFVFCRNVMIYFDKPTQERLVNRLFDVIAPGGLLFTGHSESLTGVHHRFRYVEPTIYQRPK